MIFFTADHHFGHANIIRYQNRPFDTVADMDNELINRWNQRVHKHDVVYHLGDFTLGIDAAKYFSALNGRIFVLDTEWHHDKRWLSAYKRNQRALMPNVHLLPPLETLEHLHEDEITVIALCHYPLAEWDRKHYGAWHLHGHSHGHYVPPRAADLIMDVGVDSNDFYPVSMQEVGTYMRGRDGA